MAHTTYGEVSLEGMVRAAEKVRDRLLRTTATLENAGVPYAVVGGSAVAACVSCVVLMLLAYRRQLTWRVRLPKSSRLRKQHCRCSSNGRAVAWQ
jgi:hypothetical protein